VVCTEFIGLHGINTEHHQYKRQFVHIAREWGMSDVVDEVPDGENDTGAPAEAHFRPEACLADLQDSYFYVFSSQPAIPAAFGNKILKVVPLPSVLSTEIVPMCASTMLFTMERPRPVPTIWRVSDVFTR
jgi:hypothetical protein